MEWWTHLWLNEGFATWVHCKKICLCINNDFEFCCEWKFTLYLFQVSYLATDSLFPEWKIWTQFLDESTEGLRLDGLEESHPIEVTKISIYVIRWDFEKWCQYMCQESLVSSFLILTVNPRDTLLPIYHKSGNFLRWRLIMLLKLTKYLMQ